MCASIIGPLYSFIQQRGGLDTLLSLSDMLNAGMSHKRIAERFAVDPGQLCRVIKSSFDVRYILKPDVEELMNAIFTSKRARYADLRESARVINLRTSRSPVTPPIR